MIEKLIAHRARGFGAREHSIEALKSAMVAGVCNIEIDLVSTLDGCPVAKHSPWVVGGSIENISKINYTKLKEKHPAIASLEDILIFHSNCAASSCLLLDIKDHRCIGEVIRLIRQHQGKIKIVSWIPSILQEIYSQIGCSHEFYFSFLQTKAFNSQFLNNLSISIRLGKLSLMHTRNAMSFSDSGCMVATYCHEIPKNLMEVIYDTKGGIFIPKQLLCSKSIEYAKKNKIKIGIFTEDSAANILNSNHNIDYFFCDHVVRVIDDIESLINEGFE